MSHLHDNCLHPRPASWCRFSWVGLHGAPRSGVVSGLCQGVRRGRTGGACRHATPRPSRNVGSTSCVSQPATTRIPTEDRRPCRSHPRRRPALLPLQGPAADQRPRPARRNRHRTDCVSSSPRPSRMRANSASSGPTRTSKTGTTRSSPSRTASRSSGCSPPTPSTWPPPPTAVPPCNHDDAAATARGGVGSLDSASVPQSWRREGHAAFTHGTGAHTPRPPTPLHPPPAGSRRRLSRSGQPRGRRRYRRR